MKIKLVIVLTAAAMILYAAGNNNEKNNDARSTPRLLNYQGYLTDTLSNPITNPSVAMVFTIFDAVSSGNLKWTEIQSSVSVDKGIFHVLLGGVNPIPDSVFNAGIDRWLELTIEGQALTPRTRIVSVPYAYSATFADTALYAVNSASDIDWSFLISDAADTTLQMGGRWGLARAGNTMYGNADSTHVNFGVGSITGTNGQNNKYCTVGGGQNNTASGNQATVGGGYNNTASGDWYATVGGGYNNTASNVWATVDGGQSNTASGPNATVGGGGNNIASNNCATVGGGSTNTASNICATVGGGQYNTAADSFNFIGGGYMNRTAGKYSAILGGYADTIASTGAYSYLFGINSNLTQDSTFMVDMPHVWFGIEVNGYEFPYGRGTDGQVMKTNGSGILSWGSIAYVDSARIAANSYKLQGKDTVDLNNAYVNEGQVNSIANAMIQDGAVTTTKIADTAVTMPKIAPAGALAGQVIKWNGTAWQPSADSSMDNDWTYRITDGADTTLQMGGRWGLARFGNTMYGNVDSTYVNLGVACVTGANGQNYKYITVGGGFQNTASEIYATVSGGSNNTANDHYAFVGGGNNNIAGFVATIGGGWFNTAGNSSTVGGGQLNSATSYGSITGGMGNLASGFFSTISGGGYNRARGQYSVVGGGGVNSNVNPDSNSAIGNYSVIGGGYSNIASGLATVIGGGYNNDNSGDYSVIPGGYADSIAATGDYSYLFGINSNLTQDSTFMVDMPHVWFGTEVNGYEFPYGRGTDGQVMKTNGSGILSWGSIAYVDSARVAANAHKLQGKDTVDFNVDYVNEGQVNSITNVMIQDGAVTTSKLSDTAVTMPKIAPAGATAGQVIKWNGTAWQPSADSSMDNDWTYRITDGADTTLQMGGRWGIARGAGNTLYGNADSTHVNLGVGCVTGTSGLNDKYCTVSGGYSNTARGNNATVGGGAGNFANGDWATVTGGTGNTASNHLATVGGGYQNTASGSVATISGGRNNTASDSLSYIGGGYLNSVAGKYSVILGGYADTISAGANYSYLFGINSNLTQGSTFMVDMPHIRFGKEGGGGYEFPTTDGISGQALITNGGGNLSWATIRDKNWTYRVTDGADTTLEMSGRWGLARFGNISYGNADSTHVNLGVACTTGTGGNNFKYTTIAGGLGNSARNDYATVGGGYQNRASNNYAAVGGGIQNIASGWVATVGGGVSNQASNEYATVGGGSVNIASGIYAIVGGGRANKARGQYSVVSGGGSTNEVDSNSAIGDYSTIGGGYRNVATGFNSVIGGGYYNSANNEHTTVGGGYHNVISNGFGSIAGGYNNTVTGWVASVAGGSSNLSSGFISAIGGGSENIASAHCATVSGGSLNIASDSNASVGGGKYNKARGKYSVVSGGGGLIEADSNSAMGDFSSILGGRGNKIAVTGDYSYLFGINSNLTQDSTFMVDMPHVWFGTEANGYEFPYGRGTDGQVMKTNGSGLLSWGSITYIDSARVAANSHKLQGKDTADFNVDYVNEGQVNSITNVMIQDGAVTTTKIADTAVTMPKIAPAGATVGQVIKWNGTAWLPSADSSMDNDWTISGSNMYSAVSGNVGIGTTNPLNKLHVQNGNVVIDRPMATSILSLGTVAGVTGRIFAGDAGGGNLNTNYNQVKMTADPANTEELLRLHTGADAMSNTGTAALYFGQFNLADMAAIKAVNEGGQPLNRTAGLSFWTEPAGTGVPLQERMRIAGNGNIGIGTTNPSQKLDVAGTAQVTGFKMPTSAANGYILTSDASGVGTWQALPAAPVTSVFGRTGAVVAASGDYTTTLVTEGTNLYFTNARAQVAITGGASTITTNNLTANRALLSDGSGKVAVSITTNTELGYLSGVTSAIQTQLSGKAPLSSPTFSGNVTMPGTGIWNSSGNVGIGTTSPSVKLDVAGSVKIADGTQALGRVFTSDASGLGSWQAIPNDNDWTYRITDGADTTLQMGGRWGITRFGNTLLGNADSTHVNLGNYSETGSPVSNTHYCTIGGGYNNSARDEATTVAGGYANHAYNNYTTITGGFGNIAYGSSATISGGYGNATSGNASTVGGGAYNKARGQYSVVSGGGSTTEADSNSAIGDNSAIGGGYHNIALGNTAVICGGYSNTASNIYTTVGGGYLNTAGNDRATVSGGTNNTASGMRSTIGGGWYNTASNLEATVAGGTNNNASGNQSTIAGGGYNISSGSSCAIGGGYGNSSDGNGSVIAGGESNSEVASFAAIGGGKYNNVNGDYSHIGGGENNQVLGYHSAILGGYADTIFATGHYSYLFGINSNLTQDSTFLVDLPHIRFGTEAAGYEFPNTDGSNGQALVTNGSGQVSFGTPTKHSTYTPGGSSDPNGSVGDVVWDDGYVYVKTSAGWKRSALSSW